MLMIFQNNIILRNSEQKFKDCEKITTKPGMLQKFSELKFHFQ